MIGVAPLSYHADYPMIAFLRPSGTWPALLYAAAGTAALAGNLLYLASLPRVRGYFLYGNPWFISAQGISSALVILAAAWIVYGPGRLMTRLATAACWVGVMLVLWHALLRTPRWPWIKYEEHAITLGTWLGAIGLFAAAWRFGIRILDAKGRTPASDPRSRQFSLAALLALLTGVAIVLGFLRLIVPSKELEWWRPSPDEVLRLVSQIASSLLVASTIVTCFHVRRPAWLNLVLCGSFTLAIAVLHLLTYGQLWRMYLFPPEPRLLVMGVHYLQLAPWLLAALALLHCYGLRLERCSVMGRPVLLAAGN